MRRTDSGVGPSAIPGVQFKRAVLSDRLIFLIFDVEVIFLFPIAIAYQDLSFFSVIAAVTRLSRS